MLRSLAAVFAIALAAPGALTASAVRASDRTLPMQFDLRQPAVCADSCSTLIFASGAITADTPRAFQNFAKGKDLTGATLVLDSDGGSVLGAIAFGRDLRRRALTTTVGRMEAGADERRAKISPDADCESMCVFVLLGGAHRYVPPQAQVMVHQIWLGDRRNDPTAASYSAEDLSLVQRDIGSLAQYTVDMGASIELLNISLRIPPWERMHLLTRQELRRVALDNGNESPARAPVPVASVPSVMKVSTAPTTSGRASASPINENSWTLIDGDGDRALARRHTLTLEGEEIGSFDLALSCSSAGGYTVQYTERRKDAGTATRLNSISLLVGDTSAPMSVVSSHRDALNLVTIASATLPAKVVADFAGPGSHSMVVETEGATATAIRIGNTGAMQNLPALTAGCGKGAGKEARLTVKKTGSLAAAQ